MSRKEFSIAILFSAAVVAVFFYKYVFFGQIPFPGDLLIAEYNPWKTYSFLGYVPGSFPNKAQNIDVIRELYPWKTLAIGQLKAKEIPFWNPYSFSGAPLLANFQSAVFYPFNFLYLIFSQITAWSLLVLLQSFLSLFFTYLFARKIGISKLGAFVCSLSFAFSYFMSVWVEYNTMGHIILWLPLALLGIEHLLFRFSLRWSMLFVLSLVFSLLAGHPQVFSYLFVFVFGYFVFRLSSCDNKLEKIASIVPLQLLSLGIGGMQLLPGLELIRESARSPHDYQFLINKILIQPMQLVMFFVPDIFGNAATRNYWLGDTYIGKVTSIGTIPLLFISISIIRKKERLEKFFLAACAFILLIATNNPFTRLLYIFNIPLISSSSPTLAVFILSFSLSLITGFGFDKYRNLQLSLKKLTVWFFPLVLIFFLVFISALFLGEHRSIAVRNLAYNAIIFSAGVFLMLVAGFRKQLFLVVLLALIVVHSFDLWRSFNKFNPFSQRELVFPQNEIFTFLKNSAGINRFWGYGSATIEANYATQYFVFSPDGSDPLYPKRYGQLIHSSVDGKLLKQFNRFNRSDAVIAPGFGQTDFSSNQYRMKVLDVLGVKYILDREENASTSITFPVEKFKLIHKTDGWKILENLHTAPRFFLAYTYQIFTTDSEFENIFFSKNFDPASTILLEEKPKGNLKKGDADSVKLLFYSPNKIEFVIHNKYDALFYISDTFYPGWKAYIDNKETKIYRANYAFRAVALPSGSRKVVFVFSPDSFTNGVRISSASILSTLLICSMFWRKKKVMQ